VPTLKSLYQVGIKGFSCCFFIKHTLIFVLHTIFSVQKERAEYKKHQVKSMATPHLADFNDCLLEKINK